MKKPIAVSLVIMWAGNAIAIEAGCPIKLSKHSTNKNLTSLPATFAYTHSQKNDVEPEDKETYSIDAALSIHCPSGIDTEYMLGIEVHKNDLTTKESDSVALRAGYSFDNRLSDHYKLDLSGGFAEDRVKDEQSVQLIADLGFLYPDWYINSYWIGKSSAFVWSPYAALELERVIDDPDEKTGNVSRLMYGAGATYYFVEDKDGEKYRFSIDLSYKHWHNLSQDDALELSDNHELMMASFNWILLYVKDEYEVALSYKYQNGEDVRNKIAENEFDQIGFNVSFTFK